MRRSNHLGTVVIGLILCGVLLVRGSAAWAAERGNDANGKKLYLTYCFTCHGKDGKGEGYAAKVQPVRPRDLTSDTYMSTRTDEQLFKAISLGKCGFSWPDGDAGVVAILDGAAALGLGGLRPHSPPETTRWRPQPGHCALRQLLLDLPWQDWQGRWPDCRDLQATTPRPDGSGVSLQAHGPGPVQRHQSGRWGRRAFPHHARLGGCALTPGDLGSRRVCPSILKTAMTLVM